MKNKDTFDIKSSLKDALVEFADAKLKAQGIDPEEYHAAEQKFAHKLKEIARHMPSPDEGRLRDNRDAQLALLEYLRRRKNPDGELIDPDVEFLREHGVIPDRQWQLFRCRYTEQIDSCSNLESTLSGEYCDVYGSPAQATATPPNTAHGLFGVLNPNDAITTSATHISSVEYRNIPIPRLGEYCGRAWVSINGYASGIGHFTSEVTLSGVLKSRIESESHPDLFSTTLRTLFVTRIPLAYVELEDLAETVYINKQGFIGVNPQLNPSDGPFKVTVMCCLTLRCSRNAFGYLSTSSGDLGVYFEGLEEGRREYY